VAAPPDGTAMSDYFTMSIDMLRRAFPAPPSDREYRAILRIMGPHMSHRNLADVMIVFTGREDWKVANDVLGIYSGALDDDELQRVQRLLDAAGFEGWLRAV
jgi:hypothetical protein